MNIFEQALKQKLRFDTVRGNLTTEQLFDLPLQSKSNQANLDSIAIALDTELKETSQKSFVNNVSPNAAVLELKLEIVKYIIKERMELNKKRVEEQERLSKKQQLLDLINQKEQESLSSKSLEELKAELENLK